MKCHPKLRKNIYVYIFYFNITLILLLAREPMVLPGVYSMKENPIYKPGYKHFPNKIYSESCGNL